MQNVDIFSTSLCACVDSINIITMDNEFDDLNDESYLSISVDFDDGGNDCQSQPDVDSSVQSNVVSNQEDDVEANKDVEDANANVHKDVQVNEVADKGGNNDVADMSATKTLTIREYQKVFAKQNSKYGTTKIPNSNPALCFIR